MWATLSFPIGFKDFYLQHEFHENLSFRHVLFHEKLIFQCLQEMDFAKYDKGGYRPNHIW